MKLIHNIFNNAIEINEENITVIVIENKRFFINFITNFLSKDPIEIQLFENVKELSIYKNTFILTDLLNIELNTTKQITKLYNILVQELDVTKKFVLSSNIISLVDDVCLNYHIDLDYEFEINFSDIFKSVSLNFKEGNSILDNILSLLQIKTFLEDIKLFIFVNLKSYLNKEDLTKLYDHCIINKINILLIESNVNELLNKEKITIIDNDLCVLG